MVVFDTRTDMTGRGKKVMNEKTVKCRIDQTGSYEIYRDKLFVSYVISTLEVINADCVNNHCGDKSYS